MKKLLLLLLSIFIQHWSEAQVALTSQYTFGSATGFEWGNTVVHTSDNGFILIGSTNANDGDVTNNHGGTDMWIIKIDFNGNLQWQKCYGGLCGEAGFKMKRTTDGGYIIVGTTSCEDGDVVGWHGDRDVWLVKTDSLGNLQWQKCLGGTNDEPSARVDIAADGGYFVGAPSRSSDGDVTFNHGDYDYWVCKLNSSGGIVWQKSYGGSQWEDLYAITATPDSGCIVNGETFSTDGDVTGNNLTDCWVVKLDKLGAIQWQKCIGGYSMDMGQDIILCHDGSYLAGGRNYTSDSLVPDNHGQDDFYMVNLGPGGNVLWQKNFGGSKHEYIGSMIETSDNNFTAIGSTESNNGDVINRHPSNFDLWVMKFTAKYNSIQGKLFSDLNNNLVEDGTDLPIPYRTIRETTTNAFGLTAFDGKYHAAVFTPGAFTVQPDPVSFYTAAPPSRTINFTSMQQVDSLNDFACQPTGTYNDLCVSISAMTVFRPGFNSVYSIDYINSGSTVQSPTVVFYIDTNFSFVSAVPPPTNVYADSVVWSLPSLVPFQSQNIHVTVHVDNSTLIGTLIYGNVLIEPIAGDVDTVCNRDSWKEFTIGSYDPNEIVVDRNTLTTAEMISPPYLNYIIRFQNVGNADAINVRVQNNIPADLDINSFEIVAVSDNATIDYSAPSRLMEFTFNNINLPYSSADEPGSHGFIKYRIKPFSTLVINDSIFNSASIYFDFNAPVITDSAVTVIVLPTRIEGSNLGNSFITIYPNPTHNILNVECRMQNAELKMYDMTGRMVLEETIHSPLSTINFQLSAGIYLVRVEAGEKIYQQKVVVE